MPIRQNKNQHSLSLEHIDWLKLNFSKVESYIIDLDEIFKLFQGTMKNFDSEFFQCPLGTDHQRYF